MILIDLKQFQSTPPSREATSAVDDELLRAIISIHASLAGGDLTADELGCGITPFQSTPPSREATPDLRAAGA